MKTPKKKYYRIPNIRSRRNKKIVYREAVENPENQLSPLLHGFPASHQYRKVLAQLSNEYHLIAPDYPGFGNKDFPESKMYYISLILSLLLSTPFLEEKTSIRMQ
jgi:pimeloyl-ACP methyl ester carboxylesterase